MNYQEYAEKIFKRKLTKEEADQLMADHWGLVYATIVSEQTNKLEKHKNKVLKKIKTMINEDYDHEDIISYIKENL